LAALACVPPPFSYFCLLLPWAVSQHSRWGVALQGELLNLSLWDTHAGEEMDRLRPLAYQAADLFFLCFSVVQPETCGLQRGKSRDME
jgi:hypothetical protein